MENLKKVGLEDFRVIENPKRDELSLSLEWLEKYAPFAAEVVRTHTKELVWVEPISSQTPNFASTTFHDLLGTTFLTVLSTRYIPPNIITRVKSPYPLAENLYHEATHQLFYSLIDTGEVIRPEGRGLRGPKIEIPWRDTSWTLEHAFHTLVVYLRVKPIREIAAKDGSFGIDSSAVAAAEQAIAELKEGMKDHGDLFFPKWKQELA